MEEIEYKYLEVVKEAVRLCDKSENMLINDLAYFHNFTKEEKKTNLYKWSLINTIKTLDGLNEMCEGLNNFIRR
ncbi:MAG: hypothetical protein WC720_05360 [Candidatus Shapirobacteria bacterium]|jgi:hypothetical protein